jgi:hypothetical protein
VGSPYPARRRGAMLWFNAADDVGALRTDDGERLDVPGRAFSQGDRPVGRCAGKAIELESVADVVTKVIFLAEVTPRRARMRHRR